MNERKEIIEVNGITILLVCTVIANLLAVGFMMRWYSYQSFMQSVASQKEYTAHLRSLHDTKNSVVELEGAPNWNATIYAKHFPNTKE